MGPEEFQKFMHGRGVHREQEMSRLEDHVKQSFKVGESVLGCVCESVLGCVCESVLGCV